MNAPDLNPKFPLRGKGPRVYLSHSFQDQALATSMNRALTARGLQVVQDDAESLLSQHLPTALGARIEDSEVVLCLLTETANRSDWCRQEADLAIGKARDRRSFKFLPVVFSTANLYGPVSQWSYVDATRYSSAPDIDASLLDKVHEACLGVVELLPLSEDDPFCFSSERVRALVERGACRARAILDSDGVLPTAMEEAMAFFDSIEDAAVREAVRAQEERRYTDIKKHLDADDLLFPLYFRFVDRYLRRLLRSDLEG